jgi:hypothetical protein
MDNPDTYGGPIFVPETDADEKGITTARAAEILAEPGLPLRKAKDFWRNCATAGLVHPYTRLRSGTKPYLYRADQLVIAGVLQRVAEAGLADGRLRHKVSHTLHAWNADDKPEGGPRSPAMWVLVAYAAGLRGFSFEIRSCRHAERGTFDYACRLRHASAGQGTNFHLDPIEWPVRSAWVTDVDSVLAHLIREREIAN